MDVVGDAGFSFRANDANHLRLALQELVDRPDMVEEAAVAPGARRPISTTGTG